MKSGTHRFIIGIGSQRAASTLLHTLLSDSSDAFMHPVKELHYFDTLFGVRPQEALTEFSTRQLMREVDHIVAASDLGFIGRRYKCMLRTNRILATQAIEKVDYLDLYRPFLRDREVLGEVTPEYMLLDGPQVARMREVVGENATIILMCRNPVQRVLSAAKLFNVYNNLKMDSSQMTAWLVKMIEQSSAWMQAQDSYNDYERAIEIFSSAFPNFLALSYDALIQNPMQAATSLSRVTGLQINAEVFRQGVEKRVNALQSEEVGDPEIVSFLEKRYARTFEFLQAKFDLAPTL
jgi:hypothetical protein